MKQFFNSFSLKFTEQSEPIEIAAKGVTIFVGPNNSGKSLILREIEEAARIGNARQTDKILNSAKLIWPSVDEVSDYIQEFVDLRPMHVPPDNAYYGRNRGQQFLAVQVNRQQLLDIVAQASAENAGWIAAHWHQQFLLRLDGRTRFDLVADQPSGDLSGQPASTFARIFQKDDLREAIRSAIFEAFKLHFVVDPTAGSMLRLRLASEPPVNEQSLDKSAREYHRNAMLVREASDGVQAYVGIVTSVLGEGAQLTLIDEPEAFLHPPLARKLGQFLASRVVGGGALFASTHSADFLMGCVQASPDVKVVRLEYSRGKSRAKVVNAAELNRVLTHPLMRSADVVSALFHDGVVVTEGDNDRVFYNEVYFRLREAEASLPDVLFINAQNKQTEIELIAPLRAFGVPAVAVVDIDIIKDGGQTWTDWLKAIGLPEALHLGFGQQRAGILAAFNKVDQTGKRMKSEGVNCLQMEDRAAALQLFDVLAEYGLFVVSRGELECWLSSLNAVGKKTDWTIDVLARMGSNPQSRTYVRPTGDDVWAFERNLLAWIANPSRKGTA